MSTHDTVSAARGTLPQATDTLIIGAGQAGLAVARELTRYGARCQVLDGAEQIGDQWRHQYDSLRLFTTNNMNGLPGMDFPGDPHGFATKDEMAQFLQEYARRFALPVTCRARVTSLTRGGGWFIAAGTAGTIRARQVVIATSPHGQLPAIPALAGQLDPRILQLHSSQYRRPGQLKSGPVLVVGAAHSGCDIAREVAGTHQTVLCGRDTGEVPVPWDSPLIHVVVRLVMYAYAHVNNRDRFIGQRNRQKTLEHGGPRLRVKRAELVRAGVQWNESRLQSVRDGQPVLADGTSVPVANIIWSTGFRHDYSWLKLPVLDDSGWPREFRGVATDVPGVYFCGLAYQYSMASMVLYGAGIDARYVAQRIMQRQPAPTAAAHRRRIVAKANRQA